MAIEKTMALIKPDITSQGENAIHDVLNEISARGFKVVTICEAQWTQQQAEAFYASLSGESFFNDLITFMTSDKVVMLELEAEDGVNAWRTEIGATDPALADAGTIRAIYGTTIDNNAVHGSDSTGSAATELAFLDTEFINPA